MKILMVCRPVVPPWDEASKNLVFNLCLHIDKFQFHIPSVKGNKLKLHKENVYIEDIYSSSYLNLFQKMKLFLRLLKGKPRVDVYHFFFATEALNSFFIRLVNSNFPCKIQSLPYIPYRKLKKYFNPDLFYGDYLVVTSEFSRNILREHGLQNARHIYPGIDVEKFKPSKKNMTLKSNFCNPEDFVILYAGGYRQYEAVDNLFRITAQACRNLEKVRFIFACRLKSWRDKIIENRFKRKVRGVGIDGKVSFINHYENMAELINIIDICIYPFNENFSKIDVPLVLLEALAAGKPIVISNMEPMNEVFKDEVGFMVEVGDDESFAEKIIELYENPPLRKTMGEKGRKVVSEYFNIVKTAQAYEELYEEIEQTYHFDV